MPDAIPSTPATGPDLSGWSPKPPHAPLMDVVAALQTAGLRVLEHSHRQQRRRRLKRAPDALAEPVRERLQALAPRGLWRHQALALQELVAGRSVVLSTSTSSGKSLVFRAAAAHRARQRKGTRTLVLYPAKALISDQLEGWRAMLGPLGLRACAIHGGVRVAQREAMLARSDVVLATPDVVHAWMLRDPATQPFLDQTRLLVLDEAHALDGAFGSHMIYLLHRLRACSAIDQLIATTATLAEPASFVRSLTGMEAVHIGPEQEGAPSHGRHFLRVASPSERALNVKVSLLVALVTGSRTRFLAFADSRKAVELMVELTQRELEERDANKAALVLPYRAGFEEEDRVAIQRALAGRKLRGVVTTSALELGIDIGDIDAVLLLTLPGSQRSMWQRAGRAGRSARAGVCIVWDNARAFGRGGLDAWLDRPIERCHLYVHNHLIQFGHAVCAAHEMRVRGVAVRRPILDELPARFGEMVDNELDRTVALPDDFLQLKTRLECADAPHWELPLRAGGEATYRVVQAGNSDDRLGTVTTSQMLREAYPGAIYRYVARPYRVLHVAARTREVKVRRDRRGRTTRPISHTRVFPHLQAGLLSRRDGEGLCVFEARLQVSERVRGFQERVGSAPWSTQIYGPGTAYAQAPLGRTFNTTGVCWAVAETSAAQEAFEPIRAAFCARFEIAPGDVGHGEFVLRDDRGVELPALRGRCLYDATPGSLRLTTPLVEGFAEVLELAVRLVAQEDEQQAELLQALAERARRLGPCRSDGDAERELNETFAEPALAHPGAVRVLASGQDALLVDAQVTRDVHIVAYRFGPRGMLYELRDDRPATWLVAATRVKPRADVARWVWLDAETGEPIEGA